MADRTPVVAVVGSFMMDLVFRTERRPQPGETVIGEDFGMFLGGKGVNQAVTARRLGARTFMVGRVGTDLFGDSFLHDLAAEGIDLGHVQRDPEVGTGVACPVLDAGGQNAIVVVPRANRRLTAADIDAARPALAAADVVLLQLEVSPEASLRAAELARSLGKTVILNPAPVPAGGVPEPLLRLVDVVVPNEMEAEMMTGVPVAGEAGAAAAAARLHARGVPVAVLTLGGRGALLSGAAGSQHLPGHRVEAVDTTGAGDAFCGALAVGLAQGMPPAEAVRLANVAGALAVTRLGAMPSMPDRAAVRAFCAGSGLPDPFGGAVPA